MIIYQIQQVKAIFMYIFKLTLWCNYIDCLETGFDEIPSPLNETLICDQNQYNKQKACGEDVHCISSENNFKKACSVHQETANNRIITFEDHHKSNLNTHNNIINEKKNDVTYLQPNDDSAQSTEHENLIIFIQNFDIAENTKYIIVEHFIRHGITSSIQIFNKINNTDDVFHLFEDIILIGTQIRLWKYIQQQRNNQVLQKYQHLSLKNKPQQPLNGSEEGSNNEYSFIKGGCYKENVNTKDNL